MAVLALQMVLGAGRAQAQRPMGIDVSSYQLNINWTNVKNSGVTFAYTKATEGTGYTDAYLAANEANAKAAGVLIGAYHYARPDLHPGNAGADAEAAYFWNVASQYVKTGGSYLVPMLDYEQNVTNASPAYTSATLSAWANRWCQDIVNYAAASGITLKPVFYTFTSYATGTAGYGPALDSTVTQWPLWMASYPNNPNPATGAPGSTAPWSSWNIWQYSSSVLVPGITNGPCDVDVFNGDAAGLMSTFVIGGSFPVITGNPASTSISMGSNAIFTVSVSGPTPYAYTWKFNGTNLSGATTSSYSITNAQLTNAGNYTVQITNNNGSTLSAPAILNVVGPLTNAPGSIVSPAGLVNWWPADGNAYDIFATNNGAPAGGFSYSPGELGRAFHFDGSSSSLTLGSNANLAVPWTICLWVNRESTSQTSAALMSDGTNSIKLEQYNNTHQLGVTQLGVADNVFSPAFTVPVGTWTHLAFVGTSTGTTVYVNGVQAGTVTSSFRLPGLYFGATWVPTPGKFVDFMQGSMDEVMLFNRALSGTEISAISSAGTAGIVKAPQITGTSLVNGKQFVFSMRGQTGKNYNIEYSPDMATWFSAGVLANANGTNFFTDANAYRIAKRYFRVSQGY